MKKIGLCLMVLTMFISGCNKVERKLPQETGPPDEEKVLDKIGSPTTINIPEKIQQYIEEMSVEEKIGQLLMPAFREFDYTDSVAEFTTAMENVIDEYKVGGIILFKENITGKKQVQGLISDLQENSDLPLWIGVDEEGGIVSRISSNPEMGFEPIEAAFDIGEAGNTDKAYEIGRQLGSMLGELGFNIDFAPVADIWSNPDNRVIGKRSFGNDPHIVSKMVKEVVRGLEEEEVISVVKHFPGHGDTAEDSHLGRAFVNRSLEELRQQELIPFQEAIDRGVPGVMIGHVELPQIDQGMPATLSKKIITDLLKKEMGFKGLVITDALDMEAVTSQFGKGEAAVISFLAGTDILLMPDIHEAHSHLLQACKDAKITQERLDESVYKILYTKYEYGIINEDFFKEKGAL